MSSEVQSRNVIRNIFFVVLNIFYGHCNLFPYFVYLIQEYDNDAECIVSSLALNYDDEDIDIGKKHGQCYILIILSRGAKIK